MNKEKLIEQVKKILVGIDKEQYYDENGWFETSDGAEFGKQKLDEIIKAIMEAE